MDQSDVYVEGPGRLREESARPAVLGAEPRTQQPTDPGSFRPDAHQPEFLFRDFSWHFTNTTDDFPFCR